MTFFLPFAPTLQSDKSFELSSNWEAKEVTAQKTEEFFSTSCRCLPRIGPDRKNHSSLCAAAKKHRLARKAKELNCVYKSDNCWETKSFMVEFLALYFPFRLLLLFFLALFLPPHRRWESFLCDFSHNIVTEDDEVLRYEAQLSCLLWHDGWRRREWSDECHAGEGEKEEARSS